jgi:hypothetical protein
MPLEKVVLQLQNKNRLTVQATPNHACPDCVDKNWHPDAARFKKYHPLAGTGFSLEQGDKKKK